MMMIEEATASAWESDTDRLLAELYSECPEIFNTEPDYMALECFDGEGE